MRERCSEERHGSNDVDLCSEHRVLAAARYLKRREVNEVRRRELEEAVDLGGI